MRLRRAGRDSCSAARSCAAVGETTHTGRHSVLVKCSRDSWDWAVDAACYAVLSGPCPDERLTATPISHRLPRGHDADLVSVDRAIRVAGKAALSWQRLAGAAVVVPIQVEGIGGVGIQAGLCLSLRIEVGAVAVGGCAGTTSRLK
jgi:hypothetical protein